MSETTTISPRKSYVNSSESATLKASILRNLDKEAFFFPPFMNTYLDLSFRDKMTDISTEIYAISEKYGLEPHTVCLFEKTFRKFQSQNFAGFLQNGVAN
jgi:hypothetical protein